VFERVFEVLRWCLKGDEVRFERVWVVEVLGFA
jgi:hypothetical protein